MDFGLSEEQRLLIGTVRRFVDDELRPLEQLVEDSGHLEPELAEAIQAKSRTIGLYAVNMPEELGGGGLSLERATILYEEGMKLVQVCNRLLSVAELRVTQLKDSYSGAPDELSDGDDQNS